MSKHSAPRAMAFRLAALTLIALHMVAPHLEESLAWGLWPASYLPDLCLWGLGVLSLLLVLSGPAWLARLLPRIDLGRVSWRAGIALAAAIPFLLFRIRHLRWGDAYLLANGIAHPEVRLTYAWQAPLDVWVHAKLYAVGHGLFGWVDAVPAYTILSTVAGVVFVWVLLGLAHDIGRDTAERALVIGLVGSLGTMQLFFGYVENYSFMTVGVLGYLWLALRALRRESGLLAPAAVLALTHAFHPSTIILAPTLIWVAWARLAGAPSVTWRRATYRALIEMAVPYVVVSAGVLALMTAGGHGLTALFGIDAPGGGDQRWFVPLFRATTRWEHYTMFSVDHLIDIVNLQLLSAPAIWIGLLLLVAQAARRIPWRDQQFCFLALAVGLYVVLIVTWNPDYGGQRDWDLFSPAALPAALLLAYALPRALPEPRVWRAAGWALIVMQAFHTATWIYQNTLPWSWT